MQTELPNLILIGPQGSGKGTQTEQLVERDNYVPIGVGELLRHEIASGSEMGKSIQQVLQDGELVSDEVIQKVVGQAVHAIGRDKPVLFDGFPRTIKQIHLLESFFKELNRSLPLAIYLMIPREVSLSRLLDRRICERCGHIETREQVEKNPTCERCGGTMIMRSDDKPELIEKRLQVFEQETLPLIEYFRSVGRLREVNGLQAIENVTKEIEEILKK